MVRLINNQLCESLGKVKRECGNGKIIRKLENAAKSGDWEIRELWEGFRTYICYRYSGKWIDYF